MPVTGMRGGVSSNTPAGTWSDDASLTLCTAEALVPTLDVQRMGALFVRWLQEGYWSAHGTALDVGRATRTSIERLAQGVPPSASGLTGEHDNGNGALMRILPVALRFPNAPLQELLPRTHQVAGITHAHPRSHVACGIYVAIAQHLLLGEDALSAYKNTLPQVRNAYSAQPFTNELSHFERVFSGSIHGLRRDEVHSDGYVVSTLEAALWCLLTTSSYKEAVLKAVNLSSDTDTTAAVTGGLAGIVYGPQAIPTEWLRQLARPQDITALGERLHAAVASEHP